MTQLFSNTIIGEMNSDNPRLLMAVEILYKSGPMRAHTGLGEIVIDGQTYIGVGTIGDISAIPQTSKTSPSQVQLSVSGLDPTLVAATLNEKTQGSKVKIMQCSLDDDEKITSAALLFAGRISTSRFKLGGEMSIEIDVADRLEDWQRKGGRRFDNESHLASVPGDEFFVYVPQMAEKPLYWGNKKDAPGFNYG